MKIVTVDLPRHSYPIYIGDGILSQLTIWQSHIHGKQILIVTQENIAQHYLQSLQKTLMHYQCDTIFLPSGEQYKNLTEWQKIIDVLLQKHHERSTTLIALGGGMIGDMTGFAAACYQRGVNYIQVPTTLIAQVDSAVGGKTGINHPLGKNMLGAFYQPQCVIVDASTLTTLPRREFIAGLAEVIKYGLIYDVEFFCWLEKNYSTVLKKESTALQAIIEKSLTIKASIVAQDERDNGIRNLLNFGHTFGHAIETACAYQNILHGEAVAVGMVMAAELSVQRGMLSISEMERIKNLLTYCDLPITLPDIPDLLPFMQQDKKVKNGKIQFILLKRIGEAVVTD